MASTDLGAPARSADALAERLFGGLVGAFDLLGVYLGDRLGLYRALHEAGPSTVAELAARAGTNERYTREWLESQTVSRFLDVDDPTAAQDERRYSLPAEYAEPLLEAESLAYIAPLARFLPPIGAVAPALVDAYRTGGGVAWSAYGADMREAQAGFNRPLFLHLLAAQWLPGMPEVHERLSRPGARVADVACGGGWLGIALAGAYPTLRVDAFDADPASIELARENARAKDVDDRIRFVLTDAAEPIDGTYDAVFMWESLHDLTRPVEALRTMRSLAGEDGVVLVGDERVADAFPGPTEDAVEQFMYGCSVLVCLPAVMGERPTAATGTVMRRGTVRAYAEEAGFTDVEVLPIEHDFFRVYRLVP